MRSYPKYEACGTEERAIRCVNVQRIVLRGPLRPLSCPVTHEDAMKRTCPVSGLKKIHILELISGTLARFQVGFINSDFYYQELNSIVIV